ncbi:aminopeptidase [Paenactinomyces guangxiensis]|uniref:Aminopeptidase n=1 Tax=Paenactinomyces guangxiensis TaxID=1490290 RepID=A0A7W2A6T7_9BACL|nr:aminopeptidase [Paenactinomyces guangxiensis]MBA4492875.1 aminopeptidase [Paenactinomyces guangxiensis]MBH8590277.1 aminopeptidase [Paenactinomyces guangxiensis]
MPDLRVTKLAKILVEHSCRVQRGERVLIHLSGSSRELTLALITAVYEAGGYPYVEIHDPKITRALLLQTSEKHLENMAHHALEQMKSMDCYIGISNSDNSNELSDVPDHNMSLYMKMFTKPVHLEQRVNHTKWVILRYPNPSMAQKANMSTEAFEDFFFNVCNVDYESMGKAMEPLVKRMEQTDEVRIVGPGTDLTFSIKGIPVNKCAGENNIPDGEVFTAPVRDSVNGVITFNTPTVYHGFAFENVRLEFKDGKIVQATANHTERLNQIFDTDEGARYVGEFSLGVNPNIHHPMKETLFDEKINGSFHFTPGAAYEDADNGNRSSIHWDMVSIQRTDYGGGEIYFDGKLVRKDGLFVVDDLIPLNPENLKDKEGF